ncbi:Alpha/Beta hydrolase protein [Pavlovales sp. CCMP2436]|nr:Alpha/Beta hydrolase protein [Pavlovales sp. CCMP2436]
MTQRRVLRAPCSRAQAQTAALALLAALLVVGTGAGPPRVEVTSRVADLSGFRMEYTVARAPAPSGPPLVFVHGSFHGSWCFAEHWLPYFAARGRDAFALSLRGTAASPQAPARSIGVDEHVEDVCAFLRAEVGEPVVLVGHSFGGAYVQKVLERGDAPVAAAVLLCAVPPSGNGRMIWRFLRRSPRDALRITRGFALKSAARDLSDASALFFAGALPDEAVRRYMARFAADSACGLDVRDFSKKLPNRGGAEPPAWVRSCPPILVVGAEQDAVVDVQAVEETAVFYGAKRVLLRGLGHDVMLVPGWEGAADVIGEWLADLPGSSAADQGQQKGSKRLSR